MTLAKERLHTVDTLRGLAVILMIAYHLTWDLVHLHGMPWFWFVGDTGWVIQRSIRWVFILISGACFCLGNRPVKRGILVLGCGALVTLVTMVVLPEQPIHYGILTFLGLGTLISIPLDKWLKKIHPAVGLTLCILAFGFTSELEMGRIAFFGMPLVQLPRWLYGDGITALLGFPYPSFYSSDYVPVIPWLFAFWTGYFGYRLLFRFGWQAILTKLCCRPLEWIGRHSLVIYLAHQPVLYIVLYAFFQTMALI